MLNIKFNKVSKWRAADTKYFLNIIHNILIIKENCDFMVENKLKLHYNLLKYDEKTFSSNLFLNKTPDIRVIIIIRGE